LDEAQRNSLAYQSQPTQRPKVVLIDASGIKVYGEGEWKVKVHGASKRRKWIKLHIAIDAKTQEIIELELLKSSLNPQKL